MKVPYGDKGVYILETSGWRTHRPVIEKQRCTTCGLCLAYCPVGSFYKQDGQVLLSLEYCKGCGICFNECPQKAIKWVKEDR